MERKLALLVPLAALLSACGSDADTITPTVGPITESVYASGVVKAEGQYQVYPVVNGTVVAVLVKEGDTVKAGQPIMQLDDRSSGLGERNADAQLRLLEQNASEKGPVLAQLRAAIEQARDRLTVDSTNYARQKELWAGSVGSKSDVEQREVAYSASRAGHERAVKAYAEARERLRTELEVARNNLAISAASNSDRAPRTLIDGMVYDLLIEPGELATTQRPVAVIGSSYELYMELEVDEYDIRELKPGLSAFVSLDSYAGQTFAAKVTRIIPIMDERSRSFRVEARFIDRPPVLYPNLTVEASIVIRQKDEALTIPAAYVVDGRYVLTGPEERTEVALGMKDMERVEVLSGIDSGTTLYKP